MNGVQIDPGDPNITPATLAWVTDGFIRDYANWAAVNAHANGNTDHVGAVAVGPGVPAHTWVEFSPANVAGINVLGEDHTHVRLEHVRAATGLTSFVYEVFACDNWNNYPQMMAAYNTENNARFNLFGIQAAPNHTNHASESIFPKLAVGMLLLANCLNGGAPVAELADRVAYYGLPVQRYLKIAWGFAKDVRHTEQAAPLAATAEETALSLLVHQHTAAVDGFITGLPIDGYLGDQIVGVTLPHTPALLALANAILNLLIARSAHDGGLLPPQQNQLNLLPHGTFMEKYVKLGLWRNLYFVNRVTHAVNNNVRFAGMGQQHMAYLSQNNHLPPTAHLYDMQPQGAEWRGFRVKTTTHWANHH
ncbi:hypothetical protein [Actinorhabdospora filicis]|uniref:hypothetical protein n=1 Tax=Actinorhabdospora filicis TaxID=1785913 RepID=UPI0025561DC0|nr:hypothetical protein [Actinorhabdospora filicis]